VFVLLGAINVPASQVFVLISAIFIICWPSSRWIARAVEKKSHTFTVGGAIFVGAIVTPWLINLMNATAPEWLGGRLPIIPTLAAGAIAYAFGEASDGWRASASAAVTAKTSSGFLHDCGASLSQSISLSSARRGRLS